jgi:hypothetical protein
MLRAVSALLLLLSASCALGLPSTTAPVLRRVDSTRNNGIHLAIGPTCGSKGGNATDINEGLRTLGTYKTIVSFGVRLLFSSLRLYKHRLTRSRGNGRTRTPRAETRTAARCSRPCSPAPAPRRAGARPTARSGSRTSRTTSARPLWTTRCAPNVHFALLVELVLTSSTCRLEARSRMCRSGLASRPRATLSISVRSR